MYGLIVSDFDVSETVGVVLFVLGIGFLIANLHIFWQFFCYRRLRSSALVTWPREKPPFYGWLLAFGVVAGVLVFIKLIVQQRPPIQALGEGMMLVYYDHKPRPHTCIVVSGTPNSLRGGTSTFARQDSDA